MVGSLANVQDFVCRQKVAYRTPCFQHLWPPFGRAESRILSGFGRFSQGLWKTMRVSGTLTSKLWSEKRFQKSMLVLCGFGGLTHAESWRKHAPVLENIQTGRGSVDNGYKQGQPHQKTIFTLISDIAGSADNGQKIRAHQRIRI